ncbi:SixA phosphatase family protein [Rhizobium sp. C1]|uniref:SixA phosphatase family protein n=1 Tax=Rhizobium sp. C1 TaxID=1349799 RepID=UPI001E5756B0|nr:histidine phosphatase family protein [Rhizobium sp. C1]MCD2176811.1 histidine phosphatase family protein [Rhizobium sp. C1]
MQTTLPTVSRLFLLRHAQSAWPKPGERDFDRQLDTIGRAEAERIGRAAAGMDLSPTLLVCSTAERCKQTAAAFMAAMEHAPDVSLDPDLYSAGPDHYMAICQAVASGSSVMIVGHNPMIEEAFNRLAGARVASSHIPAGFPTAGLAAFTRSGDEPWRLETLLTP